MGNKVNQSISGIYSLTPLQEGMLFHKLLDEKSNSYFEQSIFRFNGNLDLEIASDALNLTALKHEALRTTFIYKNIKQPRQVILKERNIEIQNVKISESEDVKLVVEAIKREDMERGFDLSKDTLLRVTWIVTAKETFMMWSFHHIIMDGWCLSIVLGDFLSNYRALSSGTTINRIQEEILEYRSAHTGFGQYVKWIEKQNKSEGLAYWRTLLNDCEDITEIMPMNLVENQADGTSEVSIELDVAADLVEFAKKNNVTANIIIETALGILLQKYNRSKNVVFAKVVSGRDIDLPNISDTVGLFINTIPVKVTINKKESVSQIIRQMQKQAIESNSYQYCSLADIQNETSLKGDLIKILFAFENYYVHTEAFDQEDSSIEMEMDFAREETSYDLSFMANLDDKLGLKVLYHSGKYRKGEVLHILSQMENIIKEILNNEGRPAGEICEYSQAEMQILLTENNQTQKEYSRDKTIPEVFNEIVEKYQDKTAVVYHDQRLSYCGLAKQSDGLALSLEQAGIKTGDHVVLIAEKGMDVIAAMLAIIKAGGVYIILDVNYPKSRIEYIISDCKPKIILTDQADLDLEFSCKYINIRNFAYDGQDSFKPKEPLKPSDHSSIIYTSGTTGKPKGSILQHQNILNFVKNMDCIGDSTAMLQSGALSFDASTFEIWGCLLNGGTLCMADTEVVTNAKKLKEALQHNKINTLFLTTALFNQTVTADCSTFDGLKFILTGGEKISEEHVRQLKAHNRTAKIINCYGPTENTTITTIYEIPEKFITIPIGRPVANNQVYIQDDQRLCGIGIPGELCIAGESLSKGYLHQPAQTEEKFTANPYGDGKLYHTGDLARWLLNGNIEYLGRIDEQVKIRGFRIELDEIEMVLRQYHQIKDAVVAVKEDRLKEKVICAYYTADLPIDDELLRKEIRKFLPEYMIPSFFLQIDSIPLTSNGKTDKRALPEIEVKAARGYLAPRNQDEEKIAAIFSEILGIEKVGIHDNFFDIGGHSLRATKLLNRLEAEFDSSIRLKDIFENPTVAQLRSLMQNDLGDTYQPIPKAEKKKYYAMSPAQRRMFMVNDMDQSGIAYNVPTCIEPGGVLEYQKVQDTIDELIRRHEVLRTSFEFHEGIPMQQIVDDAKAKVELVNGQEEEISTLYRKFIRPFQMNQPPLMRSMIVKMEGGNDVLFLDMHHIITDGVSMNLFINEFSEIYRGEKLKAPLRQYKDYSEWLCHKDMNAAKKYWVDQFADEIPVLNLPLDYKRPKIQSFRGNVIQQILDQKSCRKLKAMAKETKTTEYMILLSAFMILLSNYTRQEDIIVGSPFSGRVHQDTEDIMGMFVNTLALRGKPKRDKSYRSFLTEIREICMKAYEHQEYPFDELVENIKIERDISRSPLFDVFFVLQNMENKQSSINGDEEGSTSVQESTVSKYDLTLYAAELENQYIFNLEYSTDLFKESSVCELARHYIEILDSITADPDRQLGQLNMLTSEEENKIFYDFNDSEMEIDPGASIVNLFEKQVEKTPDHIAVIYQDQTLTYRELNSRANSLAGKLRETGVGPNDFVMIMTRRCIEMIVGIYGIIKAGAAYVPVDADIPAGRLHYMIKDCKPKAFLKGDLTVPAEIEVPIYDLFDQSLYAAESENLEIINKPDDLLYLIYTSGTTGNPKGVMNMHKGILNLTKWMQQKYPITENDVVMQKTAYTFDVSVTEILWWNFTGASVLMLERGGEKEPEVICQAIADNQVTMVNFAPSMLNVFLTYAGKSAENKNRISSLKYIFAAGEALSEKIVHNFYELRTDSKLVNLYGPTEASVYASYYDCQGIEEMIPIGKPVGNTQLYIVNDLQLCAVGVPGELCIAGEGLAVGYLNQQQLTAEKFLDNPFGDGKLYRTGDLVRWMPDGNIAYMGRLDDQVKIRGFRIELGEIDSVLRSIDGIHNTAVIVREDSLNEKAIHAYFEADQELDLKEIKESLKRKLPEYMIPGYLQQLDSIPVNRNGKVDRKALPAIKAVSLETFIEPETQVQRQLAEMYSDLLKIDRVGIGDNFFELGGHSLLAVSLTNKIEETIGIRLSLTQVFMNPTIALLEQELGKMKVQTSDLLIPRALQQEMYPMSSAQQRLYLVDQIDETGIAYNMPSNIGMEGKLDKERVRDALQQLVKRHEVLRTSFFVVNGEPFQKIEEEVVLEVPHVEAGSDEIKQLYRDFIKPFDLTKAPLIRAMMVSTDADHHVLFLDIHHIITDGASMNLLIHEFTKLYNQETLEPLRVQYKDYSQWMLTRDLSGQKAYWLDQFQSDIPVLDMPLDFPRPKNQTFNGNVLGGVMDSGQKYHVSRMAKETGTTEFMIFLSAMMVLLSKYSRQEDIVIGTPISGRTHQETQHMMGLFVNTLVMRGKPEQDKTVSDFLAEIKSVCLGALDHQEYPFEELVEEVVHGHDMSRNPIFDVMFSYQDSTRDIAWKVKDMELSGALEAEFTASKFDLSIDVTAVDDVYLVNIEYCTDLFTAESARLILEHYIVIVEQMTTSPDRRIGELETASEGEKAKIIKIFNNNYQPYPNHETAVTLFEKQVGLRKDKTALLFEDQSLSFEMLNRKANIIANRLREIGIRPGDYVVVIPERSLEMIIAILGIIKSGGAYVPIDPSYPENRIQYIIEDCCAKAVITIDQEDFTGNQVPVISLSAGGSLAGDERNPKPLNSREDTAYAIYTSGTTGKPKGVAVRHENLVNLIYSYQDIYQMTDQDTVLQFASISFDQSVWDIFNSLLIGASLCLMPYNLIGDTKTLEDYMEDKQVTVVALTPAYLRELDPLRVPALRVIESGGAAAELDILKKWLKCGKLIFNTYGPTEATVNAVSFQLKDLAATALPIGKPIPNTSAYILDQEKMCGIGIPGELCLAGAGVSSGYLNNEELTKQKFIKNPFGTGQLYRSGDLARWMPDGNLEYLGRIDEQVKIRGFRIELLEIQQVLRSQQGIKDAVVAIKPDQNNDPCLCAYIVSDGEPDFETIRANMKKDLPDYMIPAFFRQVPVIILNVNGKVDLSALPEMEWKSAKQYTAPETKIQSEITAIYQEILGLEQIGIHDNFFELGGHSLRALKVLNRIEERTGVRIALREIFNNTTPAQLGILVEKGRGSIYQCIPVTEKKPYYKMSSAQKRLFMIHCLEPLSLAYNMPGSIEFSGDFQIGRVREVFTKLVARHEAFRTSFGMIEGEFVQQIADHVIAEVGYQEEDRPKEELYQEFIQPFDLGKAPLIRMCIVHTKEDNYQLFIDMHHIISDGISSDIITSEFIQLYEGNEPEPLRVQYKDYSEWMLTQDFSKQRKFWTEQFADEIPVLDFPADFTRPKVQSYKGNIVFGQFDAKTHDKITLLAKQSGATEYMVLLAGFMVLLSKYSRQQDIVVGSVISGRIHEDTEKMVGMFVNTLAMRGKPEGDKKGIQFLEEIKNHCLAAYENEAYPFEELLEQLVVKRDVSRNPLFDVMFIMQNTENEEFELSGLEAGGEIAQTQTLSKFDMTMSIIEVPKGYQISLEYCADLFKQDTMERLINHYIVLMDEMASDPDKTLDQYQIADDQEKHQILELFNDTAVQYPADITVEQLFEQQVQKTPDNIAVVYQERAITYQELNQKINQVAYQLRDLGIRPDDFVVIMAKRSIEMIIGIFAIVKAGGAYVPIDPSYPQNRIDYILADCKPKAILQAYTAKIENTDIPILDLTSEDLYHGDDKDLERVNTPDDLMYLIYTSGTTGRPKGVMNTRRGCTNYIRWRQQEASLCEDDRILQKTTYTFDVSVWELFWWSTVGAGVVMLSQGAEKEPEEICREIHNKEVTTMHFVPSMLNVFVNYLELNQPAAGLLKTLKNVYVSGEALKADTVARFHKAAPGINLINLYGPTEASIDVTMFNCDQDYDKILIGKPIANIQIYILNGMQLCGIGTPGELCIAGAGLARGYLNQPELTNEKFINNPFGEGRLYRTGDLTRWLADGNIEYLGRIDEQVKVRGFRIELGEIESIIRNQNNIDDAAVIALDDQAGEKFIAAYLVSREEVDIEQLRDHLRQELPDYMVPSHFMEVEAIPVTHNGKLDRKALPKIEFVRRTEYAAPDCEEERLLAEVFEAVIGVHPIGIHDDFFEIGGDSIKAVRIAMQMKGRGYDINVKDIIIDKTIQQIAKKIIIDNGQDALKESAVTMEQRVSEYRDRMDTPLSDNPVYNKLCCYDNNKKQSVKNYKYPAQTRNKSYLKEAGGDIYFTLNIAAEYSSEGIITALQKVVKEQSVLRTYYDENEDSFVVIETAQWEIPYLDLNSDSDKMMDADLKEYCTRLYSEPELYQSGKLLVKILVARQNEGSYQIYIWAHHCIWDNMSSMVFQERLNLYISDPDRQVESICDYFSLIGTKNHELSVDINGNTDIVAFKKSTECFQSVVKMDNCSAVLYSREWEKGELQEFHKDQIGWSLKKSSVGWSYNEDCQKEDLKTIPIILDHNGRDDKNLHILGLFLELLPVTYEYENPDAVYQQIRRYQNNESLPNGVLHEYLLGLDENLQIPAIDINLIELFDAGKEEILFAEGILAKDTGLKSGAVFNVRHGGGAFAIEMSYHPEKEEDILNIIGKNYVEK